MSAALFQPLLLRGHRLRNRIVMPPMCMYEASTDGMATAFHPIHYGARSLGGAGLIIVEATAVEAIGRISDHDLGLWKDGQILGHRKIVQAIRTGGALPLVQLGHAGRKSRVSEGRPVAPSALRYSEDSPLPEALSDEGIERVVEAFATAAERAIAAGYSGVEVHGAHGYLLNSFLSPLTNQREDQWADPSALLVAVVRAVRAAIGEKRLLSLRISAEEYDEGGNHPEQLAGLLASLKNQGIDLLHVSSGGVIDVVPPAFPGYQVPFAEKLRASTGLTTVAGGLITHPEHAEAILQNQRADLVFFGRELLRHPQFPFDAAKKLGAQIPVPTPYERALL